MPIAQNRKASHDYFLPWLLPLALAGGWIAYSAFVIDHRRRLLPALDAERSSLSSDTVGALHVYVDQSVHGRPLLLILTVSPPEIWMPSPISPLGYSGKRQPTNGELGMKPLNLTSAHMRMGFAASC